MIPCCKKAGQLLSDAQERQLSLPKRIGLKIHLLMCRMCQQFEENLRLLRHSMGNILEEDSGEESARENEFRTRLKEAVQRKIDGKH